MARRWLVLVLTGDGTDGDGALRVEIASAAYLLNHRHRRAVRRGASTSSEEHRC